MFKKILYVLFGIITAAAVLLGTICLINARKTEGFLLIGLAIILMAVITLCSVPNAKDAVKKFKPGKEKGKLVCQLLQDNTPTDVVLCVYDNGIQIVQGKKKILIGMPWQNITEWISTDDATELITTDGIIALTCPSKLKQKALRQMLEEHYNA